MSKRARNLPRIESERCGARLPSRGTVRSKTVRSKTVRSKAVRAKDGRVTRAPRGAAGEWMLLPGGTWRHVRTIRVPSLFG
ncbi:hypothetical protein ABZ467_07625 [Streptomyces sp. NPDC005727]|uniref:hypothetical protein n=1 Tax=Streptomyces sp. NPDC005727 TaxID=3157053 RepID=UPI0033EDBCEC